MKPIETAIVRIFATDSDSPVGMGFLISHNRVMTCAHVVASAVNINRDEQEAPTQEIPLDFPLVDDNRLNSGRVVLWLPPQPDGSDDIALLELTAKRPNSTTVAKLIKVEQLSGRKFGAFGYPHGDGGWAHGEVRGRISGRRNQIVNKDEKSYFIEPGFSGGPVYCFDEDVQGVIGMVASGERDPDLDVGFMIPADTLLIVKDDTNIQLPDLAEPSTTASTPAEDAPRIYSSQLFSRQTQTRVVYTGEFTEMKRHFKPNHVFIAHRFGKQQDMDDYRLFIREGLSSAGLIAVFARDDSGTLLNTIVKDIINTEAGVYDVTGYNANVLIELGMSIGLNQLTAVIAEDDNTSLIPPLEQLSPLRYKDRIDLEERIGRFLRERLDDHREKAVNPLYCVACHTTACNCRRSVLEPDRTIQLVDSEPKSAREINHTLKKIIKRFELAFQSSSAAFDQEICLWVDTIKRSRIVFFHSLEGEHKHSGTDSAEVMLQIGIAIGQGTAWRMLLDEGHRMPTDLEGYKYTQRANSPSAFSSYLNSAIRELLSEQRPLAGHRDVLVAENLVMQSEVGLLDIPDSAEPLIDTLSNDSGFVMITYHPDNENAKRIAFDLNRRLKADSFSTWLDQERRQDWVGKSSWRDVVADVVPRSSALIAVYSPEQAESEEFFHEITLANQTHGLVFLLLPQEEIESEIASELGNIFTDTIKVDEDDEYYTRLVSLLSQEDSKNVPKAKPSKVDVTFIHPSGLKRTRAGVPLNVEIDRLLIALIPKLGLPSLHSDGRQLPYKLVQQKADGDRELNGSETLAGVGVQNGDTFRILAEIRGESIQSSVLGDNTPLSDIRELGSRLADELASESTKKIFISYSRKDTEIVRAFKQTHQVVGNEVFLDANVDPSREDWRATVMREVDEAEVFQLFWSQEAAISEYVKYEWLYALKLIKQGKKREDFIRPVYWEKPLPKIPRELTHLNFNFVPFNQPDTVDDLVDWFHENYKDPVDGVPWDNEEKEYVYINGGPYDATEELAKRFSNALEETIQKAVTRIESEGTYEWVKVNEY